MPTPGVPYRPEGHYESHFRGDPSERLRCARHRGGDAALDRSTRRRTVLLLRTRASAAPELSWCPRVVRRKHRAHQLRSVANRAHPTAQRRAVHVPRLPARRPRRPAARRLLDGGVRRRPGAPDGGGIRGRAVRMYRWGERAVRVLHRRRPSGHRRRAVGDQRAQRTVLPAYQRRGTGVGRHRPDPTRWRRYRP